jgi:hypothetical protein
LRCERVFADGDSLIQILKHADLAFARNLSDRHADACCTDVDNGYGSWRGIVAN